MEEYKARQNVQKTRMKEREARPLVQEIRMEERKAKLTRKKEEREKER
jgi:hypothetical protein